MAKNKLEIGEVVYLENIFNSAQWQELETIIAEIAAQPENLETVTQGKGQLENTKFSLFLYKFISRQNGTSTINQSFIAKRVLQIFYDSNLLEQISTLSGKQIDILRMQLNIMHVDGFVQAHTDYDSDSAYVCSLSIQLASDYSGGDFIIYQQETPIKVKRDNRTILAMSSRSLHEVEHVKSGTRYTINLFCG